MFAKGGFVSLPVGLAASILKIPLIIHDSDSHPGLTNRILAKYAKYIAVGQPVKFYSYPKDKLKYCGVPISKEYFKPPTKSNSCQNLKIEKIKNTKIISIIGGSLGAVRLNDSVMESLSIILKNKNLKILWVCGENSYDKINSYLINKNYTKQVKLYSYTDKILHILNIADIVVTRAGATSLAELSALKKPIIIVPNPLLTGGHQIKNAKMYKDKNAAIVLEESEIQENSKLLSDTILNLINDSSQQKMLKENLSSFSIKDSTKKISKLILENIGK